MAACHSLPALRSPAASCGSPSAGAFRALDDTVAAAAEVWRRCNPAAVQGAERFILATRQLVNALHATARARLRCGQGDQALQLLVVAGEVLDDRRADVAFQQTERSSWGQFRLQLTAETLRLVSHGERLNGNYPLAMNCAERSLICERSAGGHPAASLLARSAAAAAAGDRAAALEAAAAALSSLEHRCRGDAAQPLQQRKRTLVAAQHAVAAAQAALGQHAAALLSFRTALELAGTLLGASHSATRAVRAAWDSAAREGTVAVGPPAEAPRRPQRPPITSPVPEVRSAASLLSPMHMPGTHSPSGHSPSGRFRSWRTGAGAEPGSLPPLRGAGLTHSAVASYGGESPTASQQFLSEASVLESKAGSLNLQRRRQHELRLRQRRRQRQEAARLRAAELQRAMQPQGTPPDSLLLQALAPGMAPPLQPRPPPPPPQQQQQQQLDRRDTEHSQASYASVAEQEPCAPARRQSSFAIAQPPHPPPAKQPAAPRRPQGPQLPLCPAKGVSGIIVLHSWAEVKCELWRTRDRGVRSPKRGSRQKKVRVSAGVTEHEGSMRRQSPRAAELRRGSPSQSSAGLVVKWGQGLRSRRGERRARRQDREAVLAAAAEREQTDADTQYLLTPTRSGRSPTAASPTSTTDPGKLRFAALRIQCAWRCALARLRRAAAQQYFQAVGSVLLLRKAACRWLRSTEAARALARSLPSVSAQHGEAGGGGPLQRAQHAAAKLQSQWRRVLCSRRAAVLRADRQSSRAERQRGERRAAAAVLLQATVRRRRARRRTELLRDARRRAAVLFIWVHWAAVRPRMLRRGWWRRQQRRRARSATLIQAGWRGFCTRLDLATKRMRGRIDALRNADTAAARVLQRWMRHTWKRRAKTKVREAKMTSRIAAARQREMDEIRERHAARVAARAEAVRREQLAAAEWRRRVQEAERDRDTERQRYLDTAVAAHAAAVRQRYTTVPVPALPHAAWRTQRERAAARGEALRLHCCARRIQRALRVWLGPEGLTAARRMQLAELREAARARREWAQGGGQPLFSRPTHRWGGDPRWVAPAAPRDVELLRRRQAAEQTALAAAAEPPDRLRPHPPPRRKQDEATHADELLRLDSGAVWLTARRDRAARRIQRNARRMLGRLWRRRQQRVVDAKLADGLREAAAKRIAGLWQLRAARTEAARRRSARRLRHAAIRNAD
eukprot:TRINITY_DN9436_c0_g1_i1.p1 TRINITY_DN9436_c0_g1~~TRINITY_DN9436_c0_g1_i1.p1  ORF type:complete len:1212 (+),score=257.47 TRINITY_DN9436_c0_g1_i1:73-3636(+)